MHIHPWYFFLNQAIIATSAKPALMELAVILSFLQHAVNIL